MTTTQKWTIKKLIHNIKYYDFYTSEYEFKELSVNTNIVCGKPLVTLYCVTGLKGDEGTYNELFNRTTRQIFIGVNGGLTCYDNRKKNGKATLHSFKDIMLYGYYTY